MPRPRRALIALFFYTKFLIAYPQAWYNFGEGMKSWAVSLGIALFLASLVYLLWNSKGKEWEPDDAEMTVLVGIFLALTVIIERAAQWWKKRKSKSPQDPDGSSFY